MNRQELLRAVSMIKGTGINVLGIKRRFWISTSLFFVADIVVPGAVVVFKRERKSPLKERAFRFMGFTYHEVIDASELQNIIERLAEEPEEWEGIIKPIPPPPYPDRLPRNAEFIALNAAKATSSLRAEDITADAIINALGGVEPSHALVDKLALDDFGLTLIARENGGFDFKFSANRLKRWIELEDEIFISPGGQTIRNLLTLTAPNFIKNIALFGGPRLRPGLITIKGLSEFEKITDEFSSEMSAIGVYLDPEETRRVICDSYKKLKNEKLSWIADLCLLP